MEKNEYLESVEMNTGVEMIPCESSNIEGFGYDSKKNNFGLLLKVIEFIAMMVYLTKSATVYIKQNQKVNTLQRTLKINSKLQVMNSETKFILGLVTLGAVIYFIGENRTHPVEVSTAPSRFESPITKLISLQDSMGIKPKEREQKKQWYKYRVEIETIPENQIYKIEKSGYQQYEVSRLGETYSYVTYEFTSDKVMTTQEAYDFVKKYPERCTRVPNTSQDNIYDKYNEDYEDYINDPEDEINYPPEIFDFLAD